MKEEFTFEPDNSQLTLYVKKAPMVLRLVLITFSVLAVIGFIFGIYQAFTENELNFLSLIIPVVTALSAIYFFRLFLWNTYGKEIITFSKNQITYVADYKIFKDGENSISDHLGLHLSIIESKQSKGKHANIEFSSMDEQIKCVTNLSLKTCHEIKEELLKKGYLSAK